MHPEALIRNGLSAKVKLQNHQKQTLRVASGCLAVGMPSMRHSSAAAVQASTWVRHCEGLGAEPVERFEGAVVLAGMWARR